MPVARTAFVVTLAAPTAEDPDATTTHDVTVIHPDRLRAEQAGARLGLPSMKDAPLTATTLWAWAAMKRTKVAEVAEVDARRFLDDLCLDVENERDKSTGTTVDPTQPGEPTRSP